ncbi:UDP-glucose 4-epimerase GalE [Ornithinimicrobium tianjinense]|uniref:UDP-glucose 4-epimerase n=1 Tax=Ornithinimicrobium tianjinense TaxID=1195761 RepID=A0A917BDI7_9MICO|nr:UDP-glucose 4-epimerase GalE [Ornithinimicrobium tianjinense]GGF36359.1 UDP-glucose 4-epimerase GalE [Ornithinimicrobium tianjinense]
MRVLVTGGAGYIGSHTVLQLLAAGHDVVVADDFSNAKPSVVGRLEELSGRPVTVHAVDVTQDDALDAILSGPDAPVDAVVHFAAFKAVGESVARPVDYYRNNLDATLAVVAAMVRHGIPHLVFSSSATVYGASAPVPMTEDLPTSATNPYGWTKVMSEQILRDAVAAHPQLRVALLRYFNPVGAHPSGRIGEDPSDVPNNLMPYVAQVAVGRRERLSVFGDDYDTVDGTGVRDYIHVEDLAAGHLAALEWIATHDRPLSVWNLGSGRGTSVLELVRAFEEASGRSVPYAVVARRPGDVAESYADPSLAAEELGWRTTRTVADMCADTWRWQQANPDGYP